MSRESSLMSPKNKLNVENCVELYESMRSDLEEDVKRIKKEIERARVDAASLNQQRLAFSWRLMEERDLGFCDECKTFIPRKDMVPITWKGQRNGGDVYSGRWMEETTEKANVCQNCFQAIARQREVRILPEEELKFNPQKILDNIDKMDIGVVFPTAFEYPEFK